MIYFDNASTSYPKAPGVSDTIKNLLDQGCFNAGRGSYGDAYDMARLIFDTRQKIARFFGAKSGKQVVFTASLTTSLNIAQKGLLNPGDLVVTTPMEHNSIIRPLAQLRARGVHVSYARCDKDGTLDLDDMEKKITENTKLVIMTHASNVCGTIMPVRSVGEICRKKGALLLVDSAQTAGVLPISVKDDCIDLLAFSAHKGLLAMQGLGGLVLSQETADKMNPLISGGTGSLSHLEEMPDMLPDKLEAGSLNLPGIAALSASLDYITRIGIDTIYSRQMNLISRLQNKLQEKHSRLIHIAGTTNLTKKCAVAALNFPETDNAAVSERLDEKYGIMTRCGLLCAPGAHKVLGTYPVGVVRVSAGHMNTETEIDALIEALDEITAANQAL
ncbi:MAG: aminotransferase class V-fold PLP-dependent enzyme [Oscillospiraceae bacterium]|nr:aminotransferase class V-fold PLP-dependent enzyme [Oscillospiraceae bacterium]